MAYAQTTTAPVASFTSSVTWGYAPLTVQFNDTSSGSPTKWEWDFNDNAGDVYLSYNNNTIQKMFANGTVVTMGVGHSFYTPFSVAADSEGNVYVTNSTTVDKMYPNGTVMSIGSGFSSLYGMAVDGSGNVYVSDWGNNAVKEIYANGSVRTLVNGSGRPAGLAVDASGNVYVADAWNFVVYEVYVNGSIRTVGSGFNKPEGVAVDGDGNVYVADTSNCAVKVVYVNGTVRTLGSGFNYPSEVAVDGDGNVYVADTNNGAVKEILPNGNVVTLLSGTNRPWGIAVVPPDSVVKNPVHTYNEPGVYDVSLKASNFMGSNTTVAAGYITVYGAPVADFTANVTSGTSPLTVQFNDTSNNRPTSWSWNFGDHPYGVYVADTLNNAVYEIYANGSIVTLGSGFNKPEGVAVDTCRNLIVADTGNGAVKEVYTNGTVRTLASGFQCPTGVAVDSIGNVYVAENNNNTVYKIYTNGTVRSLAHGFQYPYGIAVDSSGNVYVADSGYQAVYEICPNRTIRTLGGGLAEPSGIAVDPQGNVYVADAWNEAVYEIYTNGTMIMLASGFYEPWGVAVDPQGNVYVADAGNFAVNEIYANGTIITLGGGFNKPYGVGITPPDSYTQNPVFTYNTPGIYNVSLTASNSAGPNTKVATSYITVYGAPVASFTANVTSGAAPLTVQFNDTSTGYPAPSYQWDFGDGSPNSSLQNPVHTYNMWGSYSVTLTVSNSMGSNTMTMSGYITIPYYVYTSPGTYTFTVPSDVNSINVSIISGGGGGGGGDAHTLYSGGGGGGGGSGYVTNQTILVSPGQNYTVTVGAGGSGGGRGGNGGNGSTSSFDIYSAAGGEGGGGGHGNTYSRVGDGRGGAGGAGYNYGATGNSQDDIADYGGAGGSGYLGYGNGGTGGGQTLSVDGGFFNGGYGFGGSSGAVLITNNTVTPTAPVASFTSNITSGAAPLTVQFNDTSSGNPTSWQWRFGDGSANETARNVTHVFTSDGTYNVTLTVGNGGGSSTLVREGYVVVGCESFTLNLVQGWNLVSFPVGNYSMNASDLEALLPGDQAVYEFNASAQKYAGYDEQYSVSGDFALAPDVGYFILSDTNTSFTVTGLALEGHSISLVPGWNLVGWSTFNATNASDLEALLPGDQAIYEFNASTQKYAGYDEQYSVSGDFAMQPGEGYFIVSTETTTLNW